MCCVVLIELSIGDYDKFYRPLENVINVLFVFGRLPNLKRLSNCLFVVISR